MTEGQLEAKKYSHSKGAQRNQKERQEELKTIPPHTEPMERKPILSAESLV